MKLAKTVKFREEKFGGVLFETLRERVFSLNPTAAAVARELAAGGTEAEIVERLKSRFSDPRGKLEEEARAFLSCLKEQGLASH